MAEQLLFVTSQPLNVKRPNNEHVPQSNLATRNPTKYQSKAQQALANWALRHTGTAPPQGRPWAASSDIIAADYTLGGSDVPHDDRSSPLRVSRSQDAHGQGVAVAQWRCARRHRGRDRRGAG